MDRELKFRFLDAIGFSREEAEAYFKRKQDKVSDAKIKIGFPLAYLNKGQLDISPELDLSRLSEVWGIVCHKTIFSISTHPGINYEEARELVMQTKVTKQKVSLPSQMVLKHDSSPERFNDVIAILKSFGINACPWEEKHYYWTSDAYFNGTVCVYNVLKDEMDTVYSDKTRNMSVRLAILL